MFIRTDEERKERQKKLAEEAKNNSADKQEIEKRKVLDNIIKTEENNNIKDKKEIEDKIELSEKKDEINTNKKKWTK